MQRAGNSERERDAKSLYSIVDEIRGRPPPVNPPSLDVMYAHYKNALNPTDRATSKIHKEYTKKARRPPIPHRQASRDTPTSKEIVATIRALKRNKAPGPDKITIEVLQALVERKTSRKPVVEMFQNVWRDGIMPVDWSGVLVAPIYKKGSPSVPKNWRPVALVSVLSKVVMKILQLRLVKILDEQLGEIQFGFRAGRSTVDAIQTLSRLCEMTSEANRHCYLAFADLTMEFDRVDRRLMWKILCACGVDRQTVKIISTMYNCHVARVKSKTECSDPFPVVVGTRQGCVLSPLLFGIYMTQVIKKTDERLEAAGLGDVGIPFNAVCTKTKQYRNTSPDRMNNTTGSARVFQTH